MTIKLEYSIVKTPVEGLTSKLWYGTNLPLFEDNIHWKHLDEIESEYALIAFNMSYELRKSGKFREVVNKYWEECLLNNKEKYFTYELDLEGFK